MVETRVPLGTPSAEHRATVEAIAQGRLLPGSKLAPVADLSDDEKIEWLRIVEPLPPGFISIEHTAIMRELVRHTVIARCLGEKVQESLADVRGLPPQDERWQALHAMMGQHRCESAEVMRLSRSLRITKQAQEQPKAAYSKTRKSTAARKPWQDWGQTTMTTTAGKA